MGRPYHQTGAYFRCEVCNKWFYRTPGQIKGGSIRSCSKKCQSSMFAGKNNPFWGRSHSDETKKKISESRKGKAIGNQNAKGCKISEEARKRISEITKALWADPEHRKHRISMLAQAAKRFRKPPELRRHRKHFSPRQRKEWSGTKCAYCKTTDDLVLDHIIPIFDGGTNAKENAQTLCRGCNLWKVENIDLPRYYAALAAKGADINP